MVESASMAVVRRVLDATVAVGDVAACVAGHCGGLGTLLRALLVCLPVGSAKDWQLPGLGGTGQVMPCAPQLSLSESRARMA